jgi:hypothetical protein
MPLSESTTVTTPVCDLISQIPCPDDGFPSAELAEHWRPRGCGIACVRMILTSHGIDPGSYWSLIEEGVAAGAHCDKGWIHQGLVDLIELRGINGHARQHATTADLAGDLLTRSLAIASVTVCFRGGQPLPSGDGVYRPGGHLVVVSGVETDSDGRPTAFRVHHPSATPANNWANRWINTTLFSPSFSGAYLRFPSPAA